MGGKVRMSNAQLLSVWQVALSWLVSCCGRPQLGARAALHTALGTACGKKVTREDPCAKLSFGWHRGPWILCGLPPSPELIGAADYASNFTHQVVYV